MKKQIYASILSLAIASSLAAPVYANVNSKAFLNDISKSYAKTEIQALVDAGIVTGDGNGTFRPSAGMTRQEFAVVLAKTLNLPTDSKASDKFTDVAEWARPYVGALVNKGITSGVSADKFGANEPISREQLAVFFIRAMGYDDVAKNSNIDISFADADKVADYAKSSVALASKIGFIKGDSDRFSPKDKAERQAVARLAYELYKNSTVYDDKIKEIEAPAIETVSTSSFLFNSNELTDGFTLKVDIKDKDGKVLAKEVLPSDIKVSYSDSYGIFKADGTIADKTKIPATGTDVVVKANVSSQNTKYNKDFNVTLKVSSIVSNVYLTDSKTIKVEFVQPIDESKVKFNLARGTITTDINTVSFASDKKSATLQFNTRLFQGNYNLTINGASQVAISKSVVVEAQKVDKIEILTDKAASTTTGATLNYRVLDQYGNDITKDSITPEIMWNVSNGIATDNNNGIITLTGSYKPNDTLVVTGIEVNSTKVVSKTVTVGDVSRVTTIDNIRLYNSINATLETNSTFSDFVLLFDVKDQYGNKITDITKLKNELFVLSTNPASLDVDVNAIGSNYGATSNSIGIPLKAGSIAGKDGTATITFLSKTTGGRGTIDVVVKKSAMVDSISLQAPLNTVAVNEEVDIPFTAIDQYGANVSNYVAFTNATDRVILNASAGSVRFVNDPVTRKAVLRYTAPSTATKTVNIIVISPTGKNSNVTFEVKDAAIPKAIVNVNNLTNGVAVSASSTIDASNFRIQDQYGRDVKLDDSFFAKYKIKVSAYDGTANNVTISDGVIDTKSEKVNFTGAVKGVETIKVEIFDITANSVVSGSEYQFNVKTVDITDIINYQVNDVSVMYHDASHTVDFNVLGLLSDNSKVMIPTSQYMVTSSFSGVTYANGKLDASGVTFSTNDPLTKKGNISVVVEGKDGPVILNKEVIVSNELPKTTNITFEDTALVKLNNGVAVVKASDTSMVNLLAAFKGKDQYNVDISLAGANVSVTNIVKSTGSTFTVTNNGTNNVTISNAKADDSFIVVMATNDGKVSTLKVVVTN